MRVYRIVRSKHLKYALGGEGAALTSGNRWNSYGTRMVYTSGSLALAMLELLVQLAGVDELPTDRYVVEVDVPDDIEIAATKPGELPAGWNHHPAPDVTRKLGDAFVAGAKTAVWRVPSSIVPTEWNYLINPLHPNAARIRAVGAEPLQLDSRLTR